MCLSLCLCVCLSPFFLILKSFNGVLRKFKGCLKFKGCFEEVSRIFQGYFKEVSSSSRGIEKLGIRGIQDTRQFAFS